MRTPECKRIEKNDFHQIKSEYLSKQVLDKERIFTKMLLRMSKFIGITVKFICDLVKISTDESGCRRCQQYSRHRRQNK